MQGPKFNNISHIRCITLLLYVALAPTAFTLAAAPSPKPSGKKDPCGQLEELLSQAAGIHEDFDNIRYRSRLRGVSSFLRWWRGDDNLATVNITRNIIFDVDYFIQIEDPNAGVTRIFRLFEKVETAQVVINQATKAKVMIIELRNRIAKGEKIEWKDTEILREFFGTRKLDDGAILSGLDEIERILDRDILTASKIIGRNYVAYKLTRMHLEAIVKEFEESGTLDHSLSSEPIAEAVRMMARKDQSTESGQPAVNSPDTALGAKVNETTMSQIEMKAVYDAAKRMLTETAWKPSNLNDHLKIERPTLEELSATMKRESAMRAKIWADIRRDFWWSLRKQILDVTFLKELDGWAKRRSPLYQNSRLSRLIDEIYNLEAREYYLSINRITRISSPKKALGELDTANLNTEDRLLEIFSRRVEQNVKGAWIRLKNLAQTENPALYEKMNIAEEKGKNLGQLSQVNPTSPSRMFAYALVAALAEETVRRGVGSLYGRFFGSNPKQDDDSKKNDASFSADPDETSSSKPVGVNSEATESPEEFEHQVTGEAMVLIQELRNDREGRAILDLKQ